MAQVVYGVRINAPGKRKLNPAAAPVKFKDRPQSTKLTRICGANASFVKKKDLSVQAERPLQTEVFVEKHVTDVEKPCETAVVVEKQLPKAEGWKAKRQKKVPYGLKENPESNVE